MERDQETEWESRHRKGKCKELNLPCTCASSAGCRRSLWLKRANKKFTTLKLNFNKRKEGRGKERKSHSGCCSLGGGDWKDTFQTWGQRRHGWSKTTNSSTRCLHVTRWDSDVCNAQAGSRRVSEYTAKIVQSLSIHPSTRSKSQSGSGKDSTTETWEERPSRCNGSLGALWPRPGWPHQQFGSKFRTEMTEAVNHCFQRPRSTLGDTGPWRQPCNTGAHRYVCSGTGERAREEVLQQILKLPAQQWQTYTVHKLQQAVHNLKVLKGSPWLFYTIAMNSSCSSNQQNHVIILICSCSSHVLRTFVHFLSLSTKCVLNVIKLFSVISFKC